MIRTQSGFHCCVSTDWFLSWYNGNIHTEEPIVVRSGNTAKLPRQRKHRLIALSDIASQHLQIRRFG